MKRGKLQQTIIYTMVSVLIVCVIAISYMLYSHFNKLKNASVSGTFQNNEQIEEKESTKLIEDTIQTEQMEVTIDDEDPQSNTEEEPQDPLWTELRSALEPLIAEAEQKGVRITVAVTDLSEGGGGRSILLGSKETYNPASVIKLSLLAALMRQVDRGIISLDAPITVKANMVVGGSGSVQYEAMPFNTTVKELARRMVVCSDNTATNVLLYYVGIPVVEELHSDLGLEVMQFNRQMFPKRFDRPPNLIDASDTMTLLNEIYNGTILSSESRDQILEWMKEQEIDTKFGAVLGDKPLSHKTGETGNVTHDVGYFLEPGHEVSIVVLSEVTTTSSFGTTQLIGNPIIQNIGLTVYDCVNGCVNGDGSFASSSP